jgi:hypothetical protein
MAAAINQEGRRARGKAGKREGGQEGSEQEGSERRDAPWCVRKLG